MLHRPVPFLLAMSAAFIVIAHAFTLWLTGFGMHPWEYNWTFVFLTLVAVTVLPLLRRRRVASIGLAVTGTAVLVTSVILVLPSRWMFRVDVFDWVRFWHAAWAYAFLLLLVAHVALNRVRLTGFARLVAAWRDARGAFVVVWTAILAAAAYTATPAGRTVFPPGAHLTLVAVASLALVLVLLAAWMALRARAAGRLAEVPDILRTRRLRTRRRALVDAGLLVVTVLAVVTGFIVLYLKAWLRGEDLWRAGLFWHSVTSWVMIALALVHVATNRRPLGAHARRVGREAASSTWTRDVRDPRERH